jgi:gliding motility-associated-like protein
VVSPGILEISFNTTESLTLLSEDKLLNINFMGLSSGQTNLNWTLLECVIYSASGYEIPAIYTKGSVDIRPVPQIYTEGSGGYCEKTPLKLNAGSLTDQKLEYEWTGPDGTTHSGAKWNLGAVDMSASGVYQVTAYDGPACSSTETLNVRVLPNPQVSISDIDTLCSDQEVKLNAGSGFVTYEWQDGSTEPQLVATSEGIYWVTVSDDNGCKASDSVLLRPCELLLWVPNAFTPYNPDGHNDKFLPEYRRDVNFTFQMLIFNKWGEQIFSTNDINEGWDGTYKGVLCTQDLYTWIITFSTPANYKFLQKSPLTGNVMLLK